MTYVRVWVLSTCVPSENDPCFPIVCGSEEEAEAEAIKALRAEWETHKPEDGAGDPRPFPTDQCRAPDWREAEMILAAWLGRDWGRYELTSHQIEVKP